MKGFEDLLNQGIRFINRNKGSGTRIIIDKNLKAIAEERVVDAEAFTSQIEGYDLVAKSHDAVASAIYQGRVDVGIGIRTVAEKYGLDFIPHSFERFDFAVKKDRLHKVGVEIFLETLKSESFRQALKETPGLHPDDSTGKPIQ